MKKIVPVLVLALCVASCSPVVIVDSKPKTAPPGQVKKVTGSKSAKAYAPGQQKKKH